MSARRLFLPEKPALSGLLALTLLATWLLAGQAAWAQENNPAAGPAAQPAAEAAPLIMKPDEPQNPAEPWPEKEDNFSTLFLQMLAALALVLAILFALNWFVRRIMPRAGLGGNANMRLLGRLSLGPRKFVAMVEVADKILILGVCDQNISLLDRVEDLSEIEPALSQGQEQVFGGLLKKAFAKGRKEQ